MLVLKLEPSTKAYIWGGEKLKNEWHKPTKDSIIAESWELSCHKDGNSTVCNGQFKGMQLSEVLKNNKDFLGTNAAKFEFFPVLNKLIDAKTNLSIQVHPSDEYALKNEGQYGKTEMWYIVEADKGAGVYCGFNKEISKDKLKEDLESGKIIDDLKFVEVKSGDCLFIPSGTVHAICGGVLIYEIQQNSSLTYRLYDYDRVDATGKKRELHIKKAIDVVDLGSKIEVNSTVEKISENEKLLAKCKYFTVKECVIKNEKTFEMDELSFEALTVIEGFGEIEYDENGSLSKIQINKGDTLFIPAGINKFKISGNLKVVSTKV